MSTKIPIPGIISKILGPPSRLSISQWAVEKPFEIAEKGAIYRGPYNMNLTPYWREPLDAACDPSVRKMNVVKPPQSGGTKFAEIILTWFLKFQATNILYIRPTEPDIAEAFRDRFKPIFERNLPELIPRSGEWVSITNNQRIELVNAIVYGAAATIPRQVTSRTTPKALYDETDTGGDTGNALGNMMDLIDQRQMAADDAQSFTLGISSPKYETGSNWVAWDKRSDRREYWEPCPHCGGYQPLLWERFKVGNERNSLTILAEDMARYQCASCDHMIEPKWQGWMCDRGVWVPKDQEIVGRLPLDDDTIREELSLAVKPDELRWEPEREGNPQPNPHRGYRIWAANTKFQQRGWSNMMAQWFEVAKTRDPERLQVFVNSWKTEPWKESIESASDERVRSRIGESSPRLVPAGAKLILGAIDIQRDSLWYLFRAFGPNQESWLIEYGTVEVSHDNYQASLHTVYERALYKGWQIKGQAEHMRAYAIAVDSGYRTDEAYEFSRRPCVIAVKGQDIADYGVKLVHVEGKLRPEPIDLYHINTKTMKDRIQRLLKQPADSDQPGRFWLHKEVSEEYIGHLTSEELKPRRGNKKVLTWQIKSQGRDNHLLDCEVYVQGLAEVLSQRREVSTLILREEDPAQCVFIPGQLPPAQSQQAVPIEPAPSDEGERESWLGPRQENWLKGSGSL